MTFPWDKINNIEMKIVDLPKNADGSVDSEACADIILDYLIYCYVMGRDNIDENLRIDAREMKDTIYRRIAGEDFEQRVKRWATDGNIYGLLTVLHTETHRVFNESMYTFANRKGYSMKTWNTMLDDRVRDTHSYLEGMEIPIDALFFTYDGDSARFPGDFALPQNDCNCRCFLTFN